MAFLLGENANLLKVGRNRDCASTSLPHCRAITAVEPMRWIVSSMAAASIVSLAAPRVGRTQTIGNVRVAVCDSALLGLAQSTSNGYHERGDRCEGLHSQQVGENGSLRLVSLVRAEATNITQLKTVHFAWPEVHNGNVALRARTNRRPFYTMTTVQAGERGGYDWETTLSRANGLKPPAFGFLAWLGDQRVHESDRVYVPVQVTDSSVRAATDTYNAIIVPSAPLKNLYVHVGELHADRTFDQWVSPPQRVQRPSFPRDTPITISLPALKGKLLRISLSAETASGVPITASFLARTP